MRPWEWHACLAGWILYKAGPECTCCHGVLDLVFGEFCLMCDSGCST